MDGVPVISVEAMRQWETQTWQAGVKPADVIEQVGRAVARRLWNLTQPGETILLLAGRGHTATTSGPPCRI